MFGEDEGKDGGIWGKDLVEETQSSIFLDSFTKLRRRIEN